MSTLATSFGGPCGAGLKAGADLSAAQCKWVKLSSGVVVLCDSQGERSIGLLGDAPKAGEGVELHAQPGETVSILVGANGVTVDVGVTPDTAGASETAGTGDVVMAIALQTATVGARVSALLVAPYVA